MTKFIRTSLLIVSLFSFGTCLAQDLLLIYPAQKDTIQANYPTFSWSSLNLQETIISYELHLVEVHENQSALSAIQSNPDWFRSAPLQTTIYTYSAEAQPLEEGKTYAWQLKAEKQSAKGEAITRKIVYSEVFTFVLASKKEERKCLPLLEQGNDAKLYVTENYKIYFTLDPSTKEGTHQLRYKIKESNGNYLPYNINPTKVNDTDYLLAIREFKEFRQAKNKNKIYTLEATDKNNIKYTLNFAFK